MIQILVINIFTILTTYFVEFMLAWKLNSISFPKHNSYKLEDPWQALNQREKSLCESHGIIRASFFWEKKQYKGFSRLFGKRLSGYMSCNPGSNRQKNTLKYFGWSFQTIILHFYRGTVQDGVVMTEDCIQIPCDLFQLCLSLGSHHP